jgi:hypothetical protein
MKTFPTFKTEKVKTCGMCLHFVLGFGKRDHGWCENELSVNHDSPRNKTSGACQDWNRRGEFYL